MSSGVIEWVLSALEVLVGMNGSEWNRHWRLGCGGHSRQSWRWG